MIKEIADRWVEALRSGNYPQGRWELHTDDDRYCCLGVLCELAVRDMVISPPVKMSFRHWYAGETKVPPPVVWQWAGMFDGLARTVTHRMLKEKFGDKIASPLYPDNGEGDNVTFNLASLNDSGVPFTVIADIIEEYWEDL
jgi:hypothetical protein